ncbi:Fur family transcriptional regulator [Anaerotalea alkaliphila]|uniref:Transcriptional repressor n=1 Tax=Anaerotalea alkaliphila TaxID=2662126 RepID=A0A7X5KMV3_9FIRM|nr:Fur family transcriptional regulator [Anaerotalea alkaliphila]NDL68224.1 transcriptional repressor [Anaerotalea alkaliphila]
MENDVYLAYETAIKEKDYKLTKQRKSVLSVLVQLEGQHLTIEELYNIVKERYPEIGLATVYRCVQMFEELNIVDKVTLQDGLTRYEIAKPNTRHHHHHLICEVCGGVLEVQDDLMGSIEQSFLAAYGFEVRDHKAKFFGVCRECRETQKEVENGKHRDD